MVYTLKSMKINRKASLFVILFLIVGFSIFFYKNKAPLVQNDLTTPTALLSASPVSIQKAGQLVTLSIQAQNVTYCFTRGKNWENFEVKKDLNLTLTVHPNQTTKYELLCGQITSGSQKDVFADVTVSVENPNCPVGNIDPDSQLWCGCISREGVNSLTGKNCSTETGE